MTFQINNISQLERFYNSLVKKMERLGNKKNRTHNETTKLDELCDKVDILEPFFTKKGKK